jgi:hypothetical protein
LNSNLSEAVAVSGGRKANSVVGRCISECELRKHVRREAEETLIRSVSTAGHGQHGVAGKNSFGKPAFERHIYKTF